MTFDEKLALGRTVDLGSHTFTAGEIKAFARKYDPQPFHVSEEEARKSILGGLCASGWHTVAMWMRHHVLARAAAEERIRAAGAAPIVFGPARSIDALEWLKPAYAGDTITFTQTALSYKAIPGRPGWYMLQSRCEAVNQEGKTIMRFLASVMVSEA
jgi:acyl dehydratase